MQTIIYKKVDTFDRTTMEKIFHLRYQVYCLEKNFLNLRCYPKELESDIYDKESVHFAAIAPSGEAVGTIRLILAKNIELPIEKHCSDFTTPDTIDRANLGEISRLAISKEVKQKSLTSPYYLYESNNRHKSKNSRPVFPMHEESIAYNLYKMLYEESINLGITHFFALMEKSLWALARIYGLSFECIGKKIDLYGPVRPYLATINSSNN